MNFPLPHVHHIFHSASPVMYTDAQQQQQLAEAYYAQAMSQKQHQLFQQQQEAAATAANAHMYYGHPPQQQQQFGDASANARGLSKAMPQPMYFQQNDAMAYAAYQQQHQQQQQQQAMYYQQAAASAAAGAMPVDTLPSPYVTAAQHKKYNTRSSQAAANAASGTGYYVRAQHQQQPMRVGGMVGVPPMAPHLAPVSAPPHTNMHNSMSTGTLASAGSSAGTVPTPPVFLAGASSAMVTPNSNSAGGYQTVDSVNAYMSDELGRSVANGTAPFSYGAPINDMPPWSPHGKEDIRRA